MRKDLKLKGLSRIEILHRVFESFIEIDTPVLLPGSGDGRNPGEVHPALHQAAEQQLQGLQPHERIGVHLPILPAGNKSRGLPVVGQVIAETH